MENEGGIGWKIGLAVACLAAVGFIVLWLMRGSEIGALEERLRRGRSESADAARRFEADIAQARTAAESAAGELADFRARQARETQQAKDEADQVASGLRSELSRTLDKLAAADREAERLKGGFASFDAVSRELADAKDRLARAEGENASLRGENARRESAAEKERQTLIAASDSLKAELARSEQSLSMLKNRADAGERERRSEIERLESRLAEAGGGPVSPSAGEPSGEWRRRIEELENALAARERELAERDGDSAELGERYRAETLRLARALEEAEARAGLAAASGDPAGQDAAEELAELRAELAAVRGDLAQASSESLKSKADLAAVRGDLAQARSESLKSKADLSAVRGDLAQARSELLKSKADLAAAKSGLEASGAEAASLRNAVAGLEKSLAGSKDDARREIKSMADLHARELAQLEKRYQARMLPFGTGPVGRSAGRILERMPDGMTMLVTGGVDQRMSQGMKFDVYRQAGAGRRYIGGIKVIRVFKDYSLAVSAFSDVRAAFCPVTGLAVLEPGARFSPFAADSAGKPVPLKASSVPGLPLEAPAAGDFLDNPFYDPDRRLTFAVSPKALESDPCFVKTIEYFGGSPRTGEDAARADFLVVADGETESAAVSPRRVTMSRLAGYMEPVLLPE